MLTFESLLNLNYHFCCDFTAVSSADVDDVRDVLQYYKQFDNPIAKFKENQRILLQQIQEKQLEEQNAPPSSVKARSWTPSFLGRK